MPINAIGFAAFVFVGMTIINRVLEGTMIAAGDVTILNQLTIFRPLQVWVFTVPVPNLEFLTVGIPRLIKWDYSFFGGNAGIIQYFLYSFTTAIAFGMFMLMIGLLYQYFSRTR